MVHSPADNLARGAALLALALIAGGCASTEAKPKSSISDDQRYFLSGGAAPPANALPDPLSEGEDEVNRGFDFATQLAEIRAQEEARSRMPLSASADLIGLPGARSRGSNSILDITPEDLAARGDGAAFAAAEEGSDTLEWGEIPTDPAALRADSTAMGARSGERIWVVVLKTFTGEGHLELASQFTQQVRAGVPALSEAKIHQTKRGSMVIVGSFNDRTDPGARQLLNSVRTLTMGDQQPFARAQLGPIRFESARDTQHPHSLLTARQLFPKVDPLYTLEVAVWSDFGSGSISLDQIQRKAEAFCGQLRTQGIPAFFYHDADKQISSVTVGLYDHRCIDPRSGLRSAQLESMHQRFPARLVNGETFQEPLYRRYPDKKLPDGTPAVRTQPSQLVEVPK